MLTDVLRAAFASCVAQRVFGRNATVKLPIQGDARPSQASKQTLPCVRTTPNRQPQTSCKTRTDLAPQRGNARTPDRPNRKARLSGVYRHSNRHAPRNIPKAQYAFKVLMIHWILQFALRIAFRCVLHRCESQDIHR